MLLELLVGHVDILESTRAAQTCRPILAHSLLAPTDCLCDLVEVDDLGRLEWAPIVVRCRAVNEKVGFHLVYLITDLFEPFGSPLLEERSQVLFRVLIPRVEAVRFPLGKVQIVPLIESFWRLLVEVAFFVAGLWEAAYLDIDALLLGGTVLIALIELLLKQLLLL